MGDSELREQFFRQLDNLYRAAGGPPLDHLIVEKTGINQNTIRGWLPREHDPTKPKVQRKRGIPRDGDQFARLIEFLMLQAKGKRPDVRELRKWEHARLTASTSVAAADAGRVTPRHEVEHANSVWIGLAEQVGADGGLPYIAELGPDALAATPFNLETEAADQRDLYLPRTANRVEHRTRSALESCDFVMLTGPSKVGKTRTLYENVRSTLPRARILVPSPSTLKDAIDLPEFRDCTDTIVVWLDDLHEFLSGENPLSPVLLAQIRARPARTIVAATIRNHAVELLKRNTGELTRDQRAVLSQAETIRLQSTSDDSSEQKAAEALYPSLNLDGFGLAEVRAGAPELLRQYEAARHADPALGAVIQAVIDWFRIGRTDPVPESQLERLCRHVVEHQWPHVDIDDSALKSAIERARMPRDGAGRVAALRTERLITGERAYRPFDYLVAADEGQDRPTRAIPHNYWAVATRDADPGDLNMVGIQAHLRGLDEIAEKLWWRAAHFEHPGALYNLGVLWQAVDKLSEAEELYRRAAAVGCVPAFSNIGDWCAERNELDEAEVWYRRGAEAGDTAARHKLARLLALTQRGDLAEEMLAPGAKAGDPVSMYNYAHTLRRHGNRMADVEYWFLQAASAGHAGAQVNLAYIMHDREDFRTAAHWYVRAYVTDLLGSTGLLAAQGLTALYLERGNLHAAKEWARRAAASGNTAAARDLALILWIQGDPAAAEDLLRPGAEAGDVPTMRTYVGLLQETGRAEEALPYLRQGAAADDLPSMSDLWRALHLCGEHDEAEHWAQRCADAGDPDAAFYLGFRHAQAGNPELAEKWYRKAAEAGHRPAMENLAIILHDKGDEAEARHWLERARDTPPSDPASPGQAT